MFVSKSKYQQLADENRQLHIQLSQINTTLEQQQARIDELENGQEICQNSDDIGFDQLLLGCTLDCINQIEGIRATVLSSYEAISTESQASHQIHNLLDKSGQALNNIVNGMERLSDNMGEMHGNINSLSEMADKINTFVMPLTQKFDPPNQLHLNAAPCAAPPARDDQSVSRDPLQVECLTPNTH